MAFSISTTQKGDSIISTLLCAHNPLFWVFDVVDAAADFVISVQITVGADTYQFDPVPDTFDGTDGTFIFYGEQIFNALLNASDDIIPTGDIALAIEMFKDIQIEAAWDIPGPLGEIFYDETLSFVNSAHDVGDTNGATMKDWEDLDSHIFYSQKDKDTYWYFYTGTPGTKYLEYTEISTIPEEVIPFVTQWSVPAASFTFPAGNTGTYDGQINYGDGTGWLDFSTYNDANFTHVYAGIGTYEISIRGDFPWMYINNGATKDLFDGVIQWGDVVFDKIEGMFYGATNFTEIVPTGQIPANPITATSAADTFRDCPNLTGAPMSFSNLVNLTSMLSTFTGDTSLTGPIPSLDANVLLQNMNFAYSNCSGITGGFPSLTYNVALVSMSSTFAGCPGITGGFPSFTTNTLINTLASTFSGCSGATGNFPDFTNNTLITTFAGTFTNCSGTSGAFPSNTFSNCTLATTFSSMCLSCTSMTGSIPDFSSCTLTTTFRQAFRNCPAMNGTISDFTNCVNVIDFYYIFNGLALLTGNSNALWLKGNNTLTGPLYDTGTPLGTKAYGGCVLLTDYVGIPAFWK